MPPFLSRANQAGRTTKAGAACCVLAFILSACGASHPASPNGALPAAQIPSVARLPAKRSAATLIHITVPKKIRRRARNGHGFEYVSPATQSIGLAIQPAGAGTTLDVTANLTPASPGCSSSGGVTSCTIQIELAPGSYKANVFTYSGLNASGALLSEGQQEPFQIRTGRINAIALAVYGIPNQLLIVPNTTRVEGSQPQGFTLFGTAAAAFIINSLDAAGDLIVGPGAPTYSALSTNSAFTLAPPSRSAPSAFTITPPGTAAAASTVVQVQATFADPTVCQQQAAACSASAAISTPPYSTDDWTTFAHDDQRTGNQTQSAGISLTNVTSLRVAWQSSQLDSAFIASPVVYGGLVIVASADGVVYALNAQSGALVWKTTLPMILPAGANEGRVKSTPAIDGDRLFLGDIYLNTNLPDGYSDNPEFPSDFYALSLTTGDIIWTTRLPGIIRGQPLAMNGRVYIGTAGGDPLNCLQGGMQALDESSGSVLWSWVVSPIPGNGGTSWSPVTFDGSHIVFGTGNTCTVPEPTANAVVALNLDGTLAWSFQGFDNRNNSDTENTLNDNDQGGGIDYVNGTYYFENKDGNLYSLVAPNLPQFIVPLGGAGSIATPTTDGTMVVADVGHILSDDGKSKHKIGEWYLDLSNKVPRFRTKNGFAPHESSSEGLVGYDLGGNPKWLVPSTSVVYQYAAINNGVVYVGVNGTLSTYSLQSGKWTGWAFVPIPKNDSFMAGPVVVPSGLYAADIAGYVYAFRPTAPEAKRR